jgi:hypothetical protein
VLRNGLAGLLSSSHIKVGQIWQMYTNLSDFILKYIFLMAIFIHAIITFAKVAVFRLFYKFQGNGRVVQRNLTFNPIFTVELPGIPLSVNQSKTYKFRNIPPEKINLELLLIESNEARFLIWEEVKPILQEIAVAGIEVEIELFSDKNKLIRTSSSSLSRAWRCCSSYCSTYYWHDNFIEFKLSKICDYELKVTVSSAADKLTNIGLLPVLKGGGFTINL